MLQLLLLLFLSECAHAQGQGAPADTLRTRLIGSVAIVGVSRGAEFERYSSTSKGIERASVKTA